MIVVIKLVFLRKVVIKLVKMWKNTVILYCHDACKVDPKIDSKLPHCSEYEENSFTGKWVCLK